MDDVLFDDGSLRLAIAVKGIDRTSGCVSGADFGLTVYAYKTQPAVTPVFTHVLDIDEARRLYSFLDSISLLKDDSQAVSGRFVEVDVGVPDSVIEALLSHPELAGDPALVRAVLELNPDLCRTILETQVEALDISSLAYRRRQLSTMRSLLDDDAFFEEYRDGLGLTGKEAVWQHFFEENQWIFGYGLNYVIGEGIQPDRLEQVVAGHSIATSGKRADGLLQTRGVLHSLCYVEIKTHETPLLHGSEYRAEVWQPSHELAGAVAQSQKTVQLAIEHLGTVLELPASVTAKAGEKFFNYAPRSVVVCGSLEQFVGPSGVDRSKFSSFELYRHSIQAPDVMTFDELYDRAAAIVETGFATRGMAAASRGDDAPGD
jgi:hypothetical protein